MKIPCSVEILTLNSEKTLRRCLESVHDFEDIIILDGNSTDKTREIAKEYGARIFSQIETTEKNIKISDFSTVRNFGIHHAKHPWFLFIDSDEYLSLGAVAEMREIVNKGEGNTHYAYKLPRKYVVKGEVIGRSSMYPNYQVRFFYVPATLGFIKKIHERISLKEGYKIGVLKNPEYVPMDNISILRKKWYNYAKMQVVASNITPAMFFVFAVRNFTTFTKYLFKYAFTFVGGEGKRMPFLYEWYNAYYHIWLIREALVFLISREQKRR